MAGVCALRAAKPIQAAGFRALSTVSPKFKDFPRQYDVCVAGGGIIGLATAYKLTKRFPNLSVCVLEKENAVARHQTGHNSGVIHAGIYYQPGTRMAKDCVEGVRQMYEFCEAHGIPYERIGKLIVASSEQEVPVVEELVKRATMNGVPGVEFIDGAAVRKMEPNVRAVAALNSPNTGIVDFASVAKCLAEEMLQANPKNDIIYNFEVSKVRRAPMGGEYSAEVLGKELKQLGPVNRIQARHVITCCGLQSDKIARNSGGDKFPIVVPFRGTYYQMKPEFKGICTRNIYPVPSNSGIPVGVHFTPTLNSQRGRQMIVGPSSCLAFAREGYQMTDFNIRDFLRSARSKGMWRFVYNNPKLSMTELAREFSSKMFLDEARKICPSVTRDMLEPSFKGVMSQVFQDNGKAAADFIIESQPEHSTIHIRNAPTPACTASLALADSIVSEAQNVFVHVEVHELSAYFRLMTRSTPSVLVVAGPSGVGKGTLLNKLRAELGARLAFSVSHTTRTPREGEEDGVQYYFVTKTWMKEAIESSQFLESVEIGGQLYGTSLSEIERVATSGRMCLLEIDVNGVSQILNSRIGSMSKTVFILPPHPETLRERLENRGTEDMATILQRLETAKFEMEVSKEIPFDKMIVNDDLDTAFEQLLGFVVKEFGI